MGESHGCSVKGICKSILFKIRYNLSQSGLNRTRMGRIYTGNSIPCFCEAKKLPFLVQTHIFSKGFCLQKRYKRKRVMKTLAAIPCHNEELAIGSVVLIARKYVAEVLVGGR